MIRSNRSRGAWVCMRCMSRVHPTDCCLIHSATGTLRREAAITKSGHGAVSGLDLQRFRLSNEAPNSRFGQRFSGLYTNCFVSYGQPRASARLVNCPLPPTLVPRRTQTFGRATMRAPLIAIGRLTKEPLKTIDWCIAVEHDNEDLPQVAFQAPELAHTMPRMLCSGEQ